MILASVLRRDGSAGKDDLGKGSEKPTRYRSSSLDRTFHLMSVSLLSNRPLIGNYDKPIKGVLIKLSSIIKIRGHSLSPGESSYSMKLSRRNT